MYLTEVSQVENSLIDCNQAGKFHSKIKLRQDHWPKYYQGDFYAASVTTGEIKIPT